MEKMMDQELTQWGNWEQDGKGKRLGRDGNGRGCWINDGLIITSLVEAVVQWEQELKWVGKQVNTKHEGAWKNTFTNLLEHYGIHPEGIGIGLQVKGNLSREFFLSLGRETSA